MCKILKWSFKHYKFTLIVLSLCVFVYTSLLNIKPRIQEIMNQCVEELFQEILTNCIDQLNYQEDELYTIYRNEDDLIVDVDFNTLKLNQILIKSLNTLNQSLDEVSHENGIRHQKIRSKDWIDYSVAVGSLFPFISLYGKGYEIPIRIQILQNLNGEIITNIEPYGINAMMLEISLSLQLSAHVDSCLGNSDVLVSTKLPLVMKVIHGQVPESYRNQ